MSLNLNRFKEYCKYGHLQSEYRRRKPSGGTYCIACHKAYALENNRRYYDRNAENIKERQRRRWHRIHTEERLGVNLRSKYGLTAVQYYMLLDQQGGVCALCASGPSENGRPDHRLFVDHCHSTGKVRGLLCMNCNIMMGWLDKRTSDELSRAFAYSGRSDIQWKCVE